MRGQPRARRLAAARHDVEDPGGQVRLLQKLGQQKRAQRRLFRRLEHDAVAARERRRDLPRGHQQWEVPRDDLSDDADGFAKRVAEVLARQRDLLRRAVQLGHPSRVVAKRRRGQRSVEEQRVVDGHSVVEGFELRELGGPLLDHVADLPQQLGPLRRRQVAPRAPVEGAARRRDGAVDVFRASLRHTRQDLAGRGVDGLEGLAACGLDPAAPDEELLRLALQECGDFQVFGDRHGSIVRGPSPR